MPDPNYIFRVELVYTKTKPELVTEDEVGNPIEYQIKEIKIPEMIDAAEALTDWPFYFGGSSGFEKAVADEAAKRVPDQTLIPKFLALRSRPMGHVWDPSADPYYHPAAVVSRKDYVVVGYSAGSSAWCLLRLWPESL